MLRFDVLRAVNMSFVVFWVVMSCSVVHGYQHSSKTSVATYKEYTLSQPRRPQMTEINVVSIAIVYIFTVYVLNVLRCESYYR